MSSDTADAERKELGAKLRALRSQAALTIAELAASAQVSASLVSQIERGVAEPSLSTLRRIVTVLKVPIGALFIGGADTNGLEQGRREWQLLVRRAARKHLRVPGSEVSYELLVPDLARRLEVITAELGPGMRVPPEPSLHSGEETILCLRGSVVCFYGEESLPLEEGDAISWDAAIPHWVTNPTSKAAEILAFITPPSF